MPTDATLRALAGSGKKKEIVLLPQADAVQRGRRRRRTRAFDMDVPEEPGAAFALLAVFVVVGFLFLLCLAKGVLSERQQTVGWFVLTVLFFSLCNALVRSNVRTRTQHVKQAVSDCRQSSALTT
jgi:hypothetical protein